MHEPSDLIVWAICIVICWYVLSTITGFEDWMKGLFGNKHTVKALEEQIKALEARVKDLENKK